MGMGATDPNSTDTLTLTITKTGGTYAGTVLPTFTSPSVGTSPRSISMTTSSALDGTGTIIYSLQVTDGTATVNGTLTVTITNQPPVFDKTGYSAANGSGTSYTATLTQGSTVGAGVLGMGATDPNSTDTLTLTIIKTGGTYAGTVLPGFTSPSAGTSPVPLR